MLCQCKDLQEHHLSCKRQCLLTLRRQAMRARTSRKSAVRSARAQTPWPTPSFAAVPLQARLSIARAALTFTRAAVHVQSMSSLDKKATRALSLVRSAPLPSAAVHAQRQQPVARPSAPRLQKDGALQRQSRAPRPRPCAKCRPCMCLCCAVLVQVLRLVGMLPWQPQECVSASSRRSGHSIRPNTFMLLRSAPTSVGRP
jgi:hypothetical protein